MAYYGSLTRASADDRYLNRDLNTSNTTYYVRTTGDDNTGLGTLANPWKTISKALGEISVRSQWGYIINVGAGVFTLPNDINCYFQNDLIEIQGNVTTAAPYTITGVTSGSRDDGIVIQVVGNPWVAHAQIGKIIKYTSGALNGTYGVVYENTTNSLTVTTDRQIFTDGIPVNGMTFDILAQNTNIQLNVRNVSTALAMIRFTDCNVTGTYRFATQAGTLWFHRSTCNMDVLNAGNNAYIRLTRSYYKNASGSSTNVANVEENATFLCELGTVIDGQYVKNISLNNNSITRFAGENVFTRLGSGGVLLRNAYLFPDTADSTLRLYDCNSGFNDRLDNIGGDSFVIFPYLAGSINNDFLVNARDGSKFIIEGGQVITALGTNICSVDGIKESYEDDKTGTFIFGVRDIGSYKRYVTARISGDYRVTRFDHYIGVQTQGSISTIDLPYTSSMEDRVLIIKDEAGAAATDRINIDPAGAETIDGNATYNITANYDAIKLISDGNGQWFII